MNSSKRLFVALLVPVLVSACGPRANLAIRGVEINTTQVNQQTYINMEAIIKLGNLGFPNIEVPIMNPSTMQVFGQLALQNLNDGTNRMWVSLDYQQVTRLSPALGRTLPNGREIPLVLGASNAILVGVPVLKNSRIYVGGDLNRDLFVGAAISIPAFDAVMNEMPVPLNIFASFPFAKNMTGVGGLFTSPSKDQNGLAVFVKKSKQASTQTLAVLNSASTLREEAPVSIDGSINTMPTELGQVDTMTMIRLNHLFNKNARVKVK